MRPKKARESPRERRRKDETIQGAQRKAAGSAHAGRPRGGLGEGLPMQPRGEKNGATADRVQDFPHGLRALLKVSASC